MPELLPFRAVRYDASAVADISAVLCPPYDVVAAEERARLAGLDEHNAIHVELPADSPTESRYEVAARAFAGWLGDGTLVRDDRPLIYVYEQRYATRDQSEAAARGFFCRLRVEAYGPTSSVLPHEHTMSGPKEDRFRLMSAVAANLSPVLFLYDDGDAGRTSERIMREICATEPAVEALGPGGLVNRLWLADPAESYGARELLRLAGTGKVTIADGHHRYETALRYRDEIGGGASDFVLALMYEARSGGLALLPWHRLLNGVDGAMLLHEAQRWFSVEGCDDATELLARVTAPGLLGLWTGSIGALLQVDRARVEPVQPGAASETLRWLDVSVLSATLNRMIGTPTEQLSADGRLDYVSDGLAAVAEVNAGRADAAFLLAPTPIADVLDVAAAGEHMPAKSTFFYPKAATGLVFNPLTD